MVLGEITELLRLRQCMSHCGPAWKDRGIEFRKVVAKHRMLRIKAFVSCIYLCELYLEWQGVCVYVVIWV
jgi:hypothetical protein